MALRAHAGSIQAMEKGNVVEVIPILEEVEPSRRCRSPWVDWAPGTVSFCWAHSEPTFCAQIVGWQLLKFQNKNVSMENPNNIQEFKNSSNQIWVLVGLGDSRWWRWSNWPCWWSRASDSGDVYGRGD